MSRNYGMGSKSESLSSFFLLLSLWLRRLLSKFEPPAALGTSILGASRVVGGRHEFDMSGVKAGETACHLFQETLFMDNVWTRVYGVSGPSVTYFAMSHWSIVEKERNQTHASGLCMATWILWVSDLYTYHHHFAWWPLWIMLRRKLDMQQRPRNRN